MPMHRLLRWFLEEVKTKPDLAPLIPAAELVMGRSLALAREHVVRMDDGRLLTPRVDGGVAIVDPGAVPSAREVPIPPGVEVPGPLWEAMPPHIRALFPDGATRPTAGPLASQQAAAPT